jgi:two-component sensor histidine kinase
MGKGQEIAGSEAAPSAWSYTPEQEGQICRGLLGVLPDLRLSVLFQDRTMTYVWAENVPETLRGRRIVGTTDEEILAPADAARLSVLKREVLASGRPARTDLVLQGATGPQHYEVRINAAHDAKGEIDGIITVLIDLTEQRRREQTLRTLLREVSHRSKNLLAIILSIATQTGRYSKTVDLFLARFRGRIQSLAASQDLVTSSNWRGASLYELILNQTARYTSDPEQSIRFSGFNPHLTPNAALHIGLGLHELVVNSVVHGALSQPGGEARVTAELVGDPPDSKAFILRWEEIVPDSRSAQLGERRFGSVALERVVPAAIDGTAHLSLEGRALTYELSVPASQFELQPAEPLS